MEPDTIPVRDVLERFPCKLNDHLRTLKHLINEGNMQKRKKHVCGNFK
jgi:hypothetical protein